MQQRQGRRVKYEHLAIHAATNDEIWIRGAELKGKNVIWTLQQQLQKTQKTQTQDINIIFQSTIFHILGACHPKYLFILVWPYKVQLLILKAKCIQEIPFH